MTFKYESFKVVGRDFTDQATVWSYTTADPLSRVVEAGYFADPRANIEQGDFILASTSSGSSILVAASESSAQLPSAAGTGWASYVDTQYPDSGSALTLAADTDTDLPNNAGNIISHQKPVDVSEFYDGSVITGRNGDGLAMMIYFKAVPNSVAVDSIDLWIDIGGTIGELYRQSFNFPKGTGIEKGVLYALPAAYTLNTWAANGGTVRARAVGGSIDIYDINYNFVRTHKAR